MVGQAADMARARDAAMDYAERVHFEGVQRRSDIAAKEVSF